MDVFDLRNRLIEDYARYTRSFIKIADPRVKAKVDGALDDGALWPEPLLQLNPTFLTGGTIDDLYVYRIAPMEFLLIINASRIDVDVAWLQERICQSQHRSGVLPAEHRAGAHREIRSAAPCACGFWRMACAGHGDGGGE